MAVTKRSTKGSSLTYTEMDNNFEAIAPRTSATGSIQVPTGSTADRDSSPTLGSLRFNSSLNAFEGYTSIGWDTLAAAISGSGEVNQNAFSVVAVSGQSNVAADQKTDTLTFVAGSNMSITTNATNDSITFASSFTQDFAYSSLTGVPTTFAPSAHNQDFSTITSTPTTIAGYGITDAFDGAFSSLTGTPTTIAGYGITDAFDGAFSSLTSTPTTIAGYGITDAFDGDYNSLTNTPTIPAAYTDSDVDTHLNQSSAGTNEVLSWNGSDYAWVAQSGGVGTETDPIVGAITGIVKADGAGTISAATAGTDYLVYSSLSMGSQGVASGSGDVSYNNTDGTFTYTPPDLSPYQTTANLNSDIDSHLNQSNPTDGHVLSWTSGDYLWVAQSGGGGGASLANFSFSTDTGVSPAIGIIQTSDPGGVMIDDPTEITGALKLSGAGQALLVNNNVQINGTININSTLNTHTIPSGTGTLALTSDLSGFLSGVAGDSTPQLGGDLDLNTNNITGKGQIKLESDTFGTNAAARLGFFKSNTNQVAGDEIGEIYFNAYQGDDTTEFTFASIRAFQSQVSSNATGQRGEITFNVPNSDGSLQAQVGVDELGLHLKTDAVIRFEGSAENNFETTLTVANPSADRTITFPNATGTVALTSDLSSAYNDTNVYTHLNQSTASSNEVLSWNGSDYAWVAQTTAYTNTNVDTHLNQSTASSNEVLSWNGSDYAWVAQNSSGIQNVVDDTTPQLGGTLDVRGFGITTSTLNGDIDITANGDGNIVLNSNVTELFTNNGAATGNVPLDVSSGNHIFVTAIGSVTFIFTGYTSGVESFTLYLARSTSNPSFSITWPASVLWSGGTVPSLPANGELDIYVFTSYNGTTWFGFQAGDAMQ
jgi:hypothetical protein